VNQIWNWWTTFSTGVGASPVVAARVSATAVLLAAIVSAFVSNWVARRTVYINAVTAERSKWIDALRSTLSQFSGMAHKISTRRRATDYSDSAGAAEDRETLQSLLSDLTLRLNPGEDEARDLLRAAKTVDKAARLHSAAAVILADEIMIRHAQWLLKGEWERVKLEASGLLGKFWIYFRKILRKRAYRQFLRDAGSLVALDRIGAGAKDTELVLLRSRMDVASVSRPKKPVGSESALALPTRPAVESKPGPGQASALPK